MRDENKEAEPSMEEILASIRRIISDDNEEEKPEEAEAEAAPEPEPEPEVVPEPEPEPEPEEEEVLELTEDDLEDASQDDIDNMFDSVEPEAEIVLEEDNEDVPEAEPVDSNESEILPIDDVDPAEDDEALVSEEISEDIVGQFDALSALLTTGYQGSGNTLEDLVRELLRPMLKQWLEINLPPLAERMVAKEIARLARTKKP